MNNVKQFIKGHAKEIIILGVVGLTAATVTVLNRKEKDVIEEVKTEELPGYDIWAMVGTDCPATMFNDVTEIVESYGRTINFEMLD